MFVSDNTLNAAKLYFNNKLSEIFSASELKLMFQLSVEKRLKLTPSDVLLSKDYRLSESDLLFFRSIVKRLLAGEPFQYIHGDTEFYGLVIKTDERALIPRPETEELVEWIINSHQLDGSSLLDLCSGTGCIALALKKVNPTAKVVGLDVSQGALDLSRENAQALKLELDFLLCDVLQDALPCKENELDIIVSNPPYITNAEKTLMKNHVLDFEPHLALFVENDQALIFYQAIAEKALIHLKPGGWLYFEINNQFGKEMIALMKGLGFKEVELKVDLQGRHRMIRGQKAI